MKFNFLVALAEKVQIIWQLNVTCQATRPSKETCIVELLSQVTKCRISVLVARRVLTGSHDHCSITDIVTRLVLSIILTCIAHTREEIVHQLLLWIYEVTIRNRWLLAT